MIDVARPHLLLFNAVYVDEVDGTVDIVEANPAGAGTARFQLSQAGIRIRSKEQGPLLWSLASGRCADGAILTFQIDGTHLHLVELKSRLTPKTWAHCRDQFRGMYLSALAVMRLLDIHDVKTVTCYIVFSEDAVTGNAANSASPALLKTTVGGSKTLGGLEDWVKSTVQLPHQRSASLRKQAKGHDLVGDFGVI